ncbi:unnamed protein product, partial [Lymnaea stagnalis]
MLEILYYGCAAIAAAVHAVINTGKYIIHINYELVARVVQLISHIISIMVSFYDHIKLVFISIIDFVLEIQTLCNSIIMMVWKVILHSTGFIHSCYSSFITFCLNLANYIINGCLAVRTLIVNGNELIMMMTQNSFGLLVSVTTAFYFTVTAIGSCCYNLILGAWHGLGFVLSSVAYFPLYVMQCIENSWRNLTVTCANIITAITKETYLGIVVLCLLYLTLSNTIRYMYCRGLSLFPRRLNSRRGRGSHFNWQVDRGFESDFEDLYGSDAEDNPLTIERDQINDSDGDSSSDEETNNTDSSSSDVSDNDSDEYTVVTEESDSDGSINSQTFSTESSDHEIEVQLPQVEQYSLRHRSSTPSRAHKFMSSPEDFDREMERERDKRKCVVCQDEIKSVLVLPCKHMCMCVLCAEQIVRS